MIHNNFKKKAEALVQRARNGDQNAIATIVMIRNAAAKGSRKALMAADIMRVYINDHPSLLTKDGIGAEDPITAIQTVRAPLLNPSTVSKPLLGGFLGALAGGLLAGPPGVLLGALAGFFGGSKI